MERRGRWRLPRGKHGIDLVRTSTLSCGQDKSYRESKDSDDARIPHEQFALSHKPPKGGLSENAYFARGSLNPANRRWRHGWPWAAVLAATTTVVAHADLDLPGLGDVDGGGTESPGPRAA
jgi:hypothetical protein